MARIENYIGDNKLLALRDLIDGAKSIALFSHVNPDGDTCGSALALAAVLRKLDKDVELYCPSEVGGKLAFLDGWREYAAPKHREYYDLGIIVDCSDRNRLGECAAVADFCHMIAVIDHHKTSNLQCDLAIVRPEVSATAELVFEIIDRLYPQFLDRDIAQLLFAAIVTDSGGFSFSSVSATTYAIGAELISLGVKPAPIFDHFLKATDKRVFDLRNRVLSRTKFFFDGKLGMIAFFPCDFAATGTSERDTEGVVNFVRDVVGVKIAVAMTETENEKFKVSIRTDDDVDASRIASVFDGGGHKNAAGCRIFGCFEEVEERLLKACGDWL